MIVHDFDIFRAAFRPSKTDAKLIVHANTVLSGAVAFKCFQAVARRHLEIVKSLCNLKLAKLSFGNTFYVHKPLDSTTVGQCLCLFAIERNDHEETLMRRVINVKRDVPRHSRESGNPVPSGAYGISMDTRFRGYDEYDERDFCASTTTGDIAYIFDLK